MNAIPDPIRPRSRPTRRDGAVALCTLALLAALGCMGLISPAARPAHIAPPAAATPSPTPLNLSDLNCSKKAAIKIDPVSSTVTTPASSNTQSGGDDVAAEIDCNGNILIRKDNLKFPLVDSGEGVKSQFVLMKDATGTLDTNSGEATRTYVLRLYFSGSYKKPLASSATTIPAGCYIGDIQWNLSTKKTYGVPYSVTDGSATFSDPAWTIPALVAGGDNYHNCGETVATDFNRQMKLPATGSTLSTSRITPVVVKTFKEKEPNDKDNPNQVAIPNRVEGGLGSGDDDYYQIIIPKGKAATIRHVATLTHTEVIDCSTLQSDPFDKYSGPLLNMNTDKSYTVTSKTTTEGLCGSGTGGVERGRTRRRRQGPGRSPIPEPETTAEETRTTTKTYTNQITFTNTTTADKTFYFYISGNSTVSGFPREGPYTLVITLN